jgi:hypothetical protein
MRALLIVARVAAALVTARLSDSARVSPSQRTAAAQKPYSGRHRIALFS